MQGFKMKLTLLSLSGLLIIFFGCTKTSMRYHGYTVSTPRIVELQELTPTVGRWETFDLIIDFTYIQTGDLLEIAGQAVLSQHYQIMYTSVLRMDTYIFFLNKESQVLETAPLINFWGSRPEEVQAFSKSYTVPGGTVGISFGYSGRVQDDDEDGRRISIFDELPSRYMKDAGSN